MNKRGLMISTEQMAEKTNLLKLLSDMGLEISIVRGNLNESIEKSDLCFIQSETELNKVPENMIYYYFNIPEKKTSSKSEFMAFLNHELRSPLNGIKGFLKLLEEENLTETQKKYFSYVNESCDSLVKTIERLDSMISDYFY